MNLERGKTKYTPSKWYLSFGASCDYAPDCASLTVWCPACSKPFWVHDWAFNYPDGIGQFATNRRVITRESGHAIAADGTLSPSVICKNCNCTFHESGVRLIGWSPDLVLTESNWTQTKASQQ